MLNRCRFALTISFILALSGCGSTRQFVDQPKLMVDGTGKGVRQATAQIFNEVTPYRVSLCDADPVSKDCKQGSAGIKANGVGGLFFPLVLTINGVTVNRQATTNGGWAIDAKVQSKADAIAPACRTAHGHILLRDNDTVSVQLQNFYCNWLVVGNVIVNVDFSIDKIDVQKKTFNGFYKIKFHGTGNAAGSGYYKAIITPSLTNQATASSQ